MGRSVYFSVIDMTQRELSTKLDQPIFAWIAMRISLKYSVILTFHKYRRNIVIYHVFTLIIRLKYEGNVWLISNIYGFQNDHGTRFGETCKVSPFNTRTTERGHLTPFEFRRPTLLVFSAVDHAGCVTFDH